MDAHAREAARGTAGEAVTKWPVLLMVRSLEHGGCERDLTKIALHLDRNRFEPHVGIFRGGFRRQELEAARVPILDLPVESFGNRTLWQGVRKMRAYVRQYNIQLVQAFDVPMDIFAAPVARWSGVPAIVTSQLSYRNLTSRGSRAALRLSDRLSQRVVVNSDAVGESLRREFGLSAKKVYLCYNGVDLTQFHPEPRVRPAPLQDASLVVGSICVMRPEKRVDWLIKAFAQIQPVAPRAKLLLVGSGPEAPRLRELAENLGLRDACHFEDSQADVAPWMRATDIYVNSSVSESFPNGLLEAMACGCCAIGSKVGGIPELITHREDGLIFDSGRLDDLAAMLRLAATDGPLRERLQAKAAETARERFSIAIATRRVESLYEELLSSANSR
jgi:L-malate glycosyltransferase